MEYAEPYHWMKQQFIDQTFTYINSFLYYEDHDTLNEETGQMMQQSMIAFGGIAPTYHMLFWISRRLSGIFIRCCRGFR